MVLKRLNPALLSELKTLTHSDVLQPVLLGQFIDKWCCLSANICFPFAASSGTAKPDSCRLTGLAATLKANQQPFSHRVIVMSPEIVAVKGRSETRNL